MKLAINVEVGGIDTNSELVRVHGRGQGDRNDEVRTLSRLRESDLRRAAGAQLASRSFLQPEAELSCSVVYDIAPGLEYYGELGPVFDRLPIHLQSHYAFYTLDVYHWSNG